jgi:hypothetical protein
VIGKRRLGAALADVGHRDQVQLVSRSISSTRVGKPPGSDVVVSIVAPAGCTPANRRFGSWWSSAVARRIEMMVRLGQP